MKTYYLEPVFDSRKSFHRKAKVEESNGIKRLISYTTVVAKIEDGKATVFDLYSATTTRHIKDFLWQNGFDFDDSNDILKKYSNN